MCQTDPTSEPEGQGQQGQDHEGHGHGHDGQGHTLAFAAPGSPAEIEEGDVFMPRFDRDGLITCIAVDAGDGRLLMVAHMNAQSLARTLETGEAWYWSRSRRQLWRKGATSGQTQRVVEMRTDCDQDALLITVAVGGDGGCCHTGRRSCFYRTVSLDPHTRQARLAPAGE